MRNGVSRVAKLWPNARIPYAISPHYTPHERALLARAVKQYHEKTCIRFVPRSGGEPDYLFIGKVDGCFSEVGRTSGVQVLSLDNGCMEYATIIHEMMHVVGFYHEHERWDRDNFIDIIWQNIDRGALDQFGKVDLSKTSYYGQPYDYKSILHYDSLAFSKNGFPTMLPKQKSATIGNAKDFSEVDLAKINRMYNCPAENKLQTAPFARAQHSPIYSAINKYDDRPKLPAQYYDGMQNSYSSNKPQRETSPLPTGPPPNRGLFRLRGQDHGVLVDGGPMSSAADLRDDDVVVREDVRVLLAPPATTCSSRLQVPHSMSK
ncbi:astacin [Ancylostoma caninum]|uniref:Metalloendopeptidase n=1 Tax=Ancylostoma caninum TaxID=29170 RepID=A0A368G4L2_ANCCA|nr:astacin [Ancylostoma caninum]